jgi:hypothetical protein
MTRIVTRPLLTTLLLLSTVIAPTGRAQDQAESDSPPYEYSLSDVVITLEDSGGWLPGYAFRIHGDGRIVLVSWGRRPRPEELEVQVDPDRVFALVERFYDIDFFNLRDDYSTVMDPNLEDDGTVKVYFGMVTCISTKVLTLEIGGYRKDVSVRYGEPKGLRQLVNEVETLANIREWLDGHARDR